MSISKEDIVKEAHRQGFEDVGFTTAEPFDQHKTFLLERQAEYGWAEAVGFKRFFRP